MSAFVVLGLVINSALVRTLSPRLAAGFVLDNSGHALLRLEEVREQLDVLVGRRERERSASCHLLLPVLGCFLVRMKLCDVVMTFAGKTHEVLACMSKNKRALKRAALFSSLVRVQVHIDLLAGFRVNGKKTFGRDLFPLGFADFHVTVTICNIAVDPVSSS